jgi:CrcB protein
MNWLWIGLGSAAGGLARAWAVTWVARRFEMAHFWGTLLVNVSGSFLIGLLFVWLLDNPGAGAKRDSIVSPLLLTGFCGGYTTFSAFSLQTLQLLRDDKWFLALINIVASVCCCLLAVWLGCSIGRALNR